VILTLGLAGQTANAFSLRVPHKPFNKMNRQEKVNFLKRQIRKDNTVIHFFKNHPSIQTLERGKEVHWAKVSLRIAGKSLHKLLTTTYNGGNWVRDWLLSHGHKCLVQIIDVENRTYDPTLNFGGGHGNTSVAYGIPQADPGTKMASAGRDWATNPMTQIRWMIGYVDSKFGSECNAAYHRLVDGTY